MIKTRWKSRAELEHALRNARKVAVFSCGTCANIIDTGGPKGIEVMKRLLGELGKEVVVAEVALACCAEELMRPLFNAHRKALADCDAVVIISCAGGVKSAILSNPGAPVIAALDTLGSAPVSFQDSPVARSVCTTCGHCVLSYTGGICPISECPTKRKYGPCDKAPKEGTACAVNPERDCVWIEIAKRGDLKALEELAEIHKRNEDILYTPQVRIMPVKPERKSFVRFAVRMLLLDRLGRFMLKIGMNLFTRFYIAVIKKYKNAQEIRNDAGSRTN
jgi:hypothetical protein